MKPARTVLVLLLAALALAACQKKQAAGPTVSAAADGSKQVTAAGVTFHWKVSGPNLDVTLSAATTGWVAVGFDPQTLMKGANIIIGYFKDGKAFVSDQYGSQLTNHAEDTSLGGQDNVTNVSGKEENGVTEISFTIPLASGDQYDKDLSSGKHTVMLAHGSEDDFVTPHSPDARAKLVLEL